MDEHPRSQVRIVLADDAVLLREALGDALGAAGFDVVGQAGDVPGLMAVVERERPDLVILDVRMPPTHTTEGLEAARQLRAASPGIAILILSQYVETRYAVDLLRETHRGSATSSRDRVTRVADSPRPSAGGLRRLVIDPEVVSRLLGRLAITPRSTS
jgi:DNA-binding NarL/FixJ family response regulator